MCKVDVTKGAKPAANLPIGTVYDAITRPSYIVVHGLGTPIAEGGYGSVGRMSTDSIPGVLAKHTVITPQKRARSGKVGALNLAIDDIRAEYESIVRLRGPAKDDWTAHIVLTIERLS